MKKYRLNDLEHLMEEMEEMGEMEGNRQGSHEEIMHGIKV